ncbi:HPr kinase/phosphorylase [Roseivivax sediminis]|uniref:Hpr(Ser) kinase/phosphatase n=1 Tax=Roseivivax sediminis TaxID=936889 RepID=A0A1I2ATC3_9RHOB|nr:HPr kinase/phosphatase C-terminal domain-containing protein [Roseivivax sediminis]SFE46130.1 Hpr(Ser) kinase/phosphatase [Roseivivax sediminis]
MPGSEILHATAIAFGARGALIRGASGSGKSSLALEAMGLGAVLVSDDRVILRRRTDGLEMSAPDPIRGLIEARGVGLLRAETCAQARLCVVVDLDCEESERLPPLRHVSLLSCDVPLLHMSAQTRFAAALVQYLKGGRKE